MRSKTLDTKYTVKFLMGEYWVVNGENKIKSFGNHFYSESDAHNYINNKTSCIRTERDGAGYA